ncbi:MAG: FecR family protein [Kofleriaceae bacterium]|nr:FecR family protein [Kofleriaceae bacterium]
MTDLKPVRPPVEPLSDLARARIEQGVWARLDQPAPASAAGPNWRWLWIGVPALAVAAVIAVFVTSSGPTTEPRADGQPARIVSGASPSSASFDDAHITLDAHSAVVVSRDVRAPSALLERGGAWFSVAPRAGRPPYVVTAGDTVVRVIGTRFRLARADERVSLEVEHGEVEVQFRGAKRAVRGGEAWFSDAPTRVRAVQTAVVAPSPDAAEPPAAQPPTVEPRPGAPVVDRTRDPEPRRESKRSTSDHAPTVEAAQVEFERLSALEVRDPAAAINGYLALARGTTPWAEPALYAAARLAADRKEPLAERLLDQYLQRFPRGRNADDARRLLANLKGVTR